MTLIPFPLERRTVLDRASRFAERLPPLRSDEAVVEAGRCLYCDGAPCMRACPTRIDIPGFIKKISSGNLKGSGRTILESNILGATCARVCPVDELCEGACVRNDIDHPVAIGRLQRYATDYLSQHNIRPFQPGTPNGYAVAVVGAGPAGLSCAAELVRAGCAVTVFDRRPLAGGLATFGIIPLREPTEVIGEEVRMIADLGVEFRLGIDVGSDVGSGELLEQYNAIFLCVGAGSHDQLPELPGSRLEGVQDALELIEAVRTRPLDEIEVGRRAAVIGAGNTAMDALTIARRLGAEKLFCLYRRSAAEMTAYPAEYESVKADETEFLWMTAPVRFVAGVAGTLAAVECVKMRLGAVDDSGRPRPEAIPGSNFMLSVDMAIYATGQEREATLYDELGLAHDHGRLLVDPQTGSTANPKVFAGGDCVSSGKDLTVVAAVAQGQNAAQAILRHLGGTKNG
jgi:dihydropyrimidine dehydrogenase (NAD+) subunit PreT